MILQNIDELKQKLLYTNIELESIKIVANEAEKKHKEEIKQLLNLLKLAYQERDEAKHQLHKHINNKLNTTSSLTSELQPVIQHIQTDNKHQLVLPTKANSSITESNSLSHGSSPVDSFIDAVSSPDFSNITDSGNVVGLVHNYNDSLSTGFVSSTVVKPDPADVIIESLLKGRSVPQQGKLVQAVREAGPLLQNLLVTGPLPRWRNPPPLQPFKIPPFSINESFNIDQKPLNSFPSSSFRMSSSTQMCPTSMLNFSNCASLAKRQKLFN